jgi:hypothetical protein
MKKVIVFALCVSSLVGCNAMLQQKPYLPVGAIPCQADYQCPQSYVCGFAGVDQYASCLYKAGSYSRY